jgi:Xaa-Pro dipeptidase
MIFTTTEYAERLRAVRAQMVARGIDVLVVDEVEHLGYLTGWHASGSLYHACLLPLDGEPIMVCRRLDEPAFRERSWLADAVFFADVEDPVAVVATTLSRKA